MTDRERSIQNGLQILRWIRRQGIVFYAGKTERETAKNALRDMPKVFPELVGQLSAIYLYRQSEQIDSAVDGTLWKDVTTNAGILYAVGLSVEAIGRGEMYLQRLFVHELTHILVPCKPGHGAEFHVTFQKLLHRYDTITGSCLESMREISEEDQEAVKDMRKNGPPPPSPYKKIPATKPHHGKTWREAHRH